MRAQIYFPHCWYDLQTPAYRCDLNGLLTFRDGINSWLEGSKHVSYGEGQFDQGGKCPPTHPKRIMGCKCLTCLVVQKLTRNSVLRVHLPRKLLS
jgi:hypothetical protein